MTRTSQEELEKKQREFHQGKGAKSSFVEEKIKSFKPVLNSYLQGMTFKEKIAFLTEVSVFCAEKVRTLIIRGVL